MSVRYAGARHAGLSEAKVAALDDLDSGVFTPRERAALRFAELMAVDHHKVDDAAFAELRRHFTEAEVVELGVAAALNLGLGRLTAILGVEPV
jgi:alkylhydroperoxidase family enzyme